MQKVLMTCFKDLQKRQKPSLLWELVLVMVECKLPCQILVNVAVFQKF